MRISFDFDETLSKHKIQRLLTIFDRSKAELFIVTSRNEALNQNHNRDLWKVVNELDIHPKNVYFTEGSFKYATLNALDIDVHFDNMPDEIALINAHCRKTIGMLVTLNIFGDMNYLANEFPTPIPTIQEEMEEFE